MNTWSEANFLERLMPPTQLTSGAKKDPCPEDELLVAFSENRLGGFVWDAVAEHLTRCGECAELQQRLLKFSSASTATDQAEWGQAEKRLENWMDAFLQTNARDLSAGDAARPAVVITSREPKRNAAGRNFRWAWSAVAGLAAVACAAVIVEFGPAVLHRGEPQVAVQNPAPAVPQAAPPSVPSAESPATAPASVTSENTAKTGAETAAAASPGLPSRKLDSGAKVSSTAPVARREITNRDGARLASTQQDTSAAVDEKPADPADTALHTARRAASQLASAVGAAIDSAAGETQPSRDGSRRGANSGTRSAAKRTALPASISLLESTPIRIQLTSGSIPANGGFEFRGTLLEPAIPVLGAVLGRDTEIRGAGTVQNGEISVVINEVIIRGAHYPLKAGSGAAKAVRVGSSDAMQVSFDQGSVYEKVSRASSAPAGGSITTATDDGHL